MSVKDDAHIAAWSPIAGMLRQDIFMNTMSSNMKALHVLADNWNHPNIRKVVGLCPQHSLKDGSGSTPLHHAKHGSAVAPLLRMGIGINDRNDKGRTAMHTAALDGRFSVIKELVRHNADITIKDSSGKTALDYATDEHLHCFLSDIMSGKKKRKSEKTHQRTLRV